MKHMNTEVLNNKLFTLFSKIAGLSSPKSIFVAAVENASSPNTGKYSLFNVSSSASAFSAARTTGNTHGCPLSVR